MTNYEAQLNDMKHTSLTVSLSGSMLQMLALFVANSLLIPAKTPALHAQTVKRTMRGIVILDRCLEISAKVPHRARSTISALASALSDLGRLESN
jgi:hypothetical protein